MKQNLYSLPESWEWRRLGDVANLINGKAYKKHELLDEGPIPVLRVGNFFSNRSWYYSDLTLADDKYCHNGDLLYAWSASFGPKIWDGGKAIYHYHIWKVITSEVIDKKYLYYLLELDSEEIKSKGNGIAMMHATKGGMEKRYIPLPPIEDQKKIAEILDAADSLRQKDQLLVEHYDRLSQSLFLDMFGDSVTNSKNWIVGSLAEHGEFKNGLNYKKGESGVKIKYLGVGSFKNHSKIKDIDSLEFIDLNNMPSDGYLLKNDDLVFVRSNGNAKLVGRCVVMYPYDAKVTFSGFCIRYRITSDKLNAAYLTHLFREKSFRVMLLKSGQGANIQNINQKLLSELSIILPPFDLQAEFAKAIAEIEKQKKLAMQSQKKSDDLFNSLLQKAFKGELTDS
jgi:type I restriction enzyme S subunit